MDYADFIPSNFKSFMMTKQHKANIKHSIAKKTLPRRIAIFGTTGTGKSTLAGLIAKSINCKNFESQMDVCGICSSCRSPTDILLVDCANVRNRAGIVAELRQSNAFCPSFSRRIVILDEAQALSKKEQASLLVPIETFTNIQIILCSSEINDISLPLRSRFVSIVMPRPSTERAFGFYRQRLRTFDISLSKEDLSQIIGVSDRIPREIVRNILEWQINPCRQKL